jgi:hypothetical protein
MKYGQRNIAEMVESERLVLEAHERYPVFYPHAEEAAHFLSTFLKSIDRDRFVFGMFLSQAGALFDRPVASGASIDEYATGS